MNQNYLPKWKFRNNYRTYRVSLTWQGVSPRSLGRYVRDDSSAFDDALHNILGSSRKAPIMIASSVGLDGVPGLGLTGLRLTDSKTQGLMDVVF